MTAVETCWDSHQESRGQGNWLLSLPSDARLCWLVSRTFNKDSCFQPHGAQEELEEATGDTVLEITVSFLKTGNRVKSSIDHSGRKETNR